MHAHVQGLETYWLAEMQFVAGNAISIADLLMCCELEQLVMLEAAAPEVLTEAVMRLVSYRCSCHIPY
jgi:hypothetical protein